MRTNRYNRRRSRDFMTDDADPMAGVSNLADVMLVLAVGIMLALIMNWHISVAGGAVTQVDRNSMQEVNGNEIDALPEGDSDGENSNLEEKGTVYIDKETGKMYLVEQNGD